MLVSNAMVAMVAVGDRVSVVLDNGNVRNGKVESVKKNRFGEYVLTLEKDFCGFRSYNAKNIKQVEKV